MNIHRYAMREIFLYAAEFSLLGIDNTAVACTAGASWLVEEDLEFPLDLQWRIRDACMTVKWSLFPETNFARSWGLCALQERCEVQSTQFCMLAAMTEDEEGWNIICSKLTSPDYAMHASF